MHPPNKEVEEFLESIELLLEGSPEGQDAALRTLLHKLERFVDIGDAEPAEVATKLLGTAVGGQKEWQTPFRESGILSFALSRLSVSDHTDPLAKQCLRVIGNSVADNDSNRELAIKDLQHIIACLTSEELRTTALAVLFNLGNDFDPAKAAAAGLRLDNTISSYLALDKIPEAALDYAMELLTWTTGSLTSVQLKDALSLETFTNLLEMALRYDPDHYDEYVAILVHYLQDPEFQPKVATPKLLDDLVSLMLDFEARLTPTENEAVLEGLSISKTDETATSDETSVLLLTQLISSISAISATDTFAQVFTVTSQVVEKVRAKLRAPADSPSTVCACVMLGNLAMSDEVCMDMVNIMEFHITLISILASSTKPALLYAAAGFMRHLTFPEANRTVLVNTGLLRTCCHLLNLSDPSVRGEAAAMLCKLVTNNFHNIEKVVFEKDEDATILTRIVEQAIAPSAALPSTAMKNPMIELGRTLVAMLRYLGRPNAEKDVDAVRQELLKVPSVARPVARLLRQRFYADARSEGLLGLGLMAQSPEGAAHVIEEIKDDGGLLDAIKEFAEGKDGGVEQQGSAAGRDYQNAIVLLQALQNNAGGEMDMTLKNQVVGLQAELGKLLV
ncbi:GTP binding protein-like protein [Cucurbitaria berberidis CBS 394.84]|uniref:GTP binding protein-like protein n=1 Tax=Cucurbitaria berberidis CBS 394.84 TaxID=1168544 RepID=A0A9P4L4L5_9PLEO|nr:GTP binding protein-like protein [Cucurbitaria berberidis CBS 394.84]KAF1842091.1 GTP binding protein-like protein [Cucurbitaria berberidis CBS 394.84]